MPNPATFAPCQIARRSLPRVLGGFVLAGATVLSSGCFRPHLTHPVEIEVFDAISGAPVAGAEIVHGAPTGKFEASLQESATTDASGIATITSIRMIDDAWWQLARTSDRDAQRGPFYDGDGFSQIPRAFERVEIMDSARPTTHHTRYRAPLWPDISVVVELPEGYRGLLAWNSVETDVAADSGWLPPAELLPARFEARTFFQAVVRPDASGVVAHPTSVAGVPGFEPTNFRSGSGTLIRMNGAPLPRVEATDHLVVRRWVAEPESAMAEGVSRSPGHLEQIPLDPSIVRAWRLRAWHVVGAPASSSGPGQSWAERWFIGSLDELRAWLSANDLHGVDAGWGLRADPDDPAAQRIYAAHKLLPLVPRATTTSPAPMWVVKRKRQQ